MQELSGREPVVPDVSALPVVKARRRADAGRPPLSERDVELLRWIGEQYAVSLPQLTGPRSSVQFL